MIAMLLVLISTMIPAIAFAKDAGKAGKDGKTYVPTAGTEYRWDKKKNKWIRTGVKFSADYDKQGKVRSVKIAWKDDKAKESESLKYNYTWKGDNLQKESFKYKSLSNGKSGESYSVKTTYNIKNKKPVKEENVCYYYDEDGQLAGSFITKTKYTWKKNNKKGSGETRYTLQKKDDKTPYTGRSTDTYTLKKGKIAASKEDGYSFKYYDNGNLKSITKTSTDGKDKSVTKFNKAGYRVKYSYSHKDEKGVVTGYVTTYKWTIADKKPKGVEWYTKELNGTTTDRYRYKYTETKKVAKSRNCDTFGIEVWLGLWGE